MIYLPGNLSAQNLNWAKGCGSSGNDFGQSIAMDESGNVYIMGYFSGTVDFDPSAGISNLISAGLTDVFFVKYASDGSLIWANNVGGTLTDRGNAIALDASGNVYITGYFNGTADFDPGAGVANLISAGGNDMFFAKYAPDGSLVGARKIGGAGNDRGVSIVLDASGEIYITGYFNGTADFDPGAGVTNLISAGGNEIFFARFSTNGSLVWAKSVGGIGADQGNSIALDGSGHVYITGLFSGTADFDPSAGTTNLISNGSTDVFFAKYTTNGTFVGSKKVGGTGSDEGQSIVLDGSGNIYITGYYSGTTDFDPNAGITNLISNGLTDVFFAKYASDGTLIWAKSVGSTGDDQGLSITIDDSENVYTTGYYSGTTDFDPNAGITNLISNGLTDIFYAKYASDGTILWAKSVGSTGDDQGLSITIDDSDNVYLTGYYSGTADFDPSTDISDLISSGGFDVFVAKYSPLVPTVITTSASSITGNTASSGGNVTSDGNASVTTRGVVWNTSTSPTVALSTKTTDGSGTGYFSSSISGLYSNTIYYVRAYATNSQGTAYGNEDTIQTTRSVEDDVPNNGDGNNDGVADSRQEDVFSILNTYTNKYITIVSLDGYTITGAEVQFQNDIINYYPSNLVKFTIAQSSAQVKIYYHGVESLTGYTFKKLNSNNTLFNFTNYTFGSEVIDGKIVATATLTLTDGGPEDYDGLVNGSITDPGGPAILATDANIPVWEIKHLVLLLSLFGFSIFKFRKIF